MEYISIQDVSDKWNISKRRIQILCREGRIDGAKVVGNMWLVPENTVKPMDGRVKNPVMKDKNVLSGVRRDLKKLLKSMYKRSNDTGMSEDTKKTYVLTILAGSLCNLYLNNFEQNYRIYEIIYKDISGDNKTFVIDDIMVSMVKDYLRRYEHDAEIDNIVSWAYQYSNKIIAKNDYSQTQFFTEKYMIQYLVDHVADISKANKIVDPCSGGGNFLVECYEKLCENSSINDIEKMVVVNADKIYGYDIDQEITKLAVVNIRIRAFAILKRYHHEISFDLWHKIKPNIFCSYEKDKIAGSLANDNRLVKNVITESLVKQEIALANADYVLTNPPFATIKGMAQEQKDYLKANYPLSNCDTCVSFLEAIYNMLAPNGTCGIVSQNAWMHLKTFTKIRDQLVTKYKIYNIINLGSGAFYDLSGEKSNVSLLILGKPFEKKLPNEKIKVLNLTSISLNEKIKALAADKKNYSKISQDEIDSANGFDFSEKGLLKKLTQSKELYKDIAVPMQGTSTGNAKKLVGYFWEHFSETDWIPVSNGGGYCRWEGLNDSVVKWGKDGENIKAQKGSALRNVKYFRETPLVFSDTGTAGLNVRVLLHGQIFIASGPGIRVTKGNAYAHLALLNSRLAANYVRTISPKLTIAAGYIGQIPVTESIYTSVILEKNAKLCVDLKQRFLIYRPNNLEYSDVYLNEMKGPADVKAWNIFSCDLTNELLKLEIECQCDTYILTEYHLSAEEEKELCEQVGVCAFTIKSNHEIDLNKLDQYMSKLMDEACVLKRSRTSKITLGSDGILEFVSKDLHINPEQIVKKISKNPFVMKKTITKYKDLLIHNVVLQMFDYNVNTGISRDVVKIDEAVEKLNERFELSFDSEKWISDNFNRVHKGIFKGVPYLMFKDGAIQRYDNEITM